MNGYVEIFEDEEGGWRWRLRGENHEILATSESYTRHEDALRGWGTAHSVAAFAEVKDV